MLPLLVSAIIASASVGANGPSGVESVPLVKLVISPEKYASKSISTSGIAREYDQGNWVLYLDCESARSEVTLNGVSFRPDSKAMSLDRLSMRYVMVHGKFQGRAGLSRLFSGSFAEVTGLTIYPLLRKTVDEPDVEPCTK